MKEYDILNASTKKFQLFNKNIHTYPFVISMPHSGTLQIELYYGTYIDNREFIEEYKPTVNDNVFYNTQRKMMRVFEKMKEII